MSEPDDLPGVLFVCLGNICRSPAAEGTMRRVVEESGLAGRVRVDSAGTADYHVGEPADARMRQAAARRGAALDGRARQVEREDFERFDLVVAMDRENLRELRRIAPPGAEPRLFSDFLPDAAPRDVPDPYYGGRDGFERVLDLVEEGCPRILEELLAEWPG